MAVPGLSAVYRLYIKPSQNLASLPSTGIALDIHLAYYITLQAGNRRMDIIKKLL